MPVRLGRNTEIANVVHTLTKIICYAIPIV